MGWALLKAGAGSSLRPRTPLCGLRAFFNNNFFTLFNFVLRRVAVCHAHTMRPSWPVTPVVYHRCGGALV
jgi:hypothetical protein